MEVEVLFLILYTKDLNVRKKARKCFQGKGREEDFVGRRAVLVKEVVFLPSSTADSKLVVATSHPEDGEK